MFKRIVSFIILIILQVSFSQNLDWNITGSGARASGMGGAFIGVADDATAINWNPGGLTVLESFEASFVGAMISDTEETEFDDTTYGSFSDEISYSHFNFSFASVAYPMTLGEKKLVLAAAFQKQLDFYADDSWEQFNMSYDYESEGGVYTLNLGGAYQIVPYLSLGTTANIWLGNSEYTQEMTAMTDNYVYGEEYQDFTGFNFTIGALFDMAMINDNIPFKFGAVVKTPFDLEFNIEEDDAGNIWNTDVDVEMPLMFGLGASYRFGDFFTLSADFEKRNYGKSIISLEHQEGGEYEEMPINPSEKDVTQFRLGMEYLVVTDNLIVPLRCGFFNYPTIFADVEYDPVEDTTTLKQVVGFGGSLGTGIIFDKFALDLSLTYNEYENKLINMPFDPYDDESPIIEEQTLTNSKVKIDLSGIFYIN